MIGLYYNNELVHVMLFNNITDNDWILSRLCTKDDIEVVDGYKILFEYFIENYKPLSGL